MTYITDTPEIVRHHEHNQSHDPSGESNTETVAEKKPSGWKDTLTSLIHHHSDDLVRIAGVAIALVFSWTGVWKYIAPIDFIALLATLIGGFPMFKEAFENIKERQMTMELSMSIAVLATLAIQQFFTGLVITLFVLIAEFLEHLTVDRGRNVLEKLIAMLPQKATVRRNTEEKEFDIAELQKDDVVIVKPGASIPVDGIVIKGYSTVDQSSLTGESMPVEKATGSQVFAGTLNQTGVLEVRISKVGEQTAFGKVLAILQEAEKNRAPIQKTADKLAARLVYLAIAGTIITWFLTHNIVAAIAALIVAGACGVAAGTPLAILAGIGRVAKEGIIIKGGIYLEQLAKVNTVVVDKTGTLTFGIPEVTTIKTFNSVSEEAVLQLAYSVEQHSEHPLAEAIVTKARKQSINPLAYSDVRYFPGKGMISKIEKDEIAVGNLSFFNENKVPLNEEVKNYLTNDKKQGTTTVLIAKNKDVIGAISFSDVLRSEAKSAVEEIKKLKCKVVLLTGDAQAVAATVAQSLSVDEVFADMLPDQKLHKVRELMQSGKKIAMVGDGINDAPALAEANVGIAMGTGTDVTLESADMTLMNNNLFKIAEALKISRQVMGVIFFNFWGTVIVDIIGIGFAFTGHLSPLGAALIHVISELTFILNSARLFNKKIKLSYK
jgi:heavy metal translocating P-type ATPase